MILFAKEHGTWLMSNWTLKAHAYLKDSILISILSSKISAHDIIVIF